MGTVFIPMMGRRRRGTPVFKCQIPVRFKYQRHSFVGEVEKGLSLVGIWSIPWNEGYFCSKEILSMFFPILRTIFCEKEESGFHLVSGKESKTSVWLQLKRNDKEIKNNSLILHEPLESYGIRSRNESGRRDFFLVVMNCGLECACNRSCCSNLYIYPMECSGMHLNALLLLWNPPTPQFMSIFTRNLKSIDRVFFDFPQTLPLEVITEELHPINSYPFEILTYEETHAMKWFLPLLTLTPTYTQ